MSFLSSGSAGQHRNFNLLLGSVEFDPYFNNVVLLLHFTGANGSSTFVDSSKYARTQSSSGGNQLTTTDFVYPDASGIDIATLPIKFSASSDFSFPAGTDFTIELRVKTTQPVVAASIVGRQSGASNNRWFLGITDQLAPPYRYSWYYSGSEILTDPTPGGVSFGSWEAIAICRIGTTTRLFRNGNLVATLLNDINDYTDTNELGIFAQPDASVPMNAGTLIDELRITKGVGRYTANYSLPVNPFPPT